MFLRIIQLGRGRLSRRSLVLAVLFLAGMILTWYTPAIVGSRALWPRVVAHLTSELDATVTTESVTLRWLAPVVLHNVSVAEMSGEPVASVASIRTEATLLALLLGGSDFGKIFIEQPELQLRLHPRGSNLEDILATYLSRTESSTGATGTIEITDGALIVEVLHGHEVAAARFDAIDAVIKLAGGDDNRGWIDVQSCRAATDRAEGSLAAALAWQSAGESTDWSATAKVQSLDLSLLQPVARRLDLSVGLKGIGDFEAEASWQEDSRRMTIELRRAAVRQLRLEAPDYLGRDRLALEQIAARGTCRVANGTWQLDGAEIECDAGRIALDGEFVWPIKPTAGTLRQLAAAAKRADLEVTGQVDLARLAATLPHALRIREGSVIESGTMSFALQSGNQSGVRQWKASVETSALTARRDGQRFTWNAPLQITVEVNQTADNWRVERLACKSSFLSLTGRGTPAAGSFALQCDLQELTGQLQEFVELGSLRAAGTMSARLDWKQGADQRVTIHGTSLLENLDLASSTIGHWHEPRLAVMLSAEGEQGDQRVTRIRTAQLELASGADRLDLQLLEPVESPSPDAMWIIGCHMSGQWTTWFTRLRPLLPAGISGDAWTITGPIDVQLTARITRHGIEIERGKLASEPFQLESPRIHIKEPAIALELEGQWDFGSYRLRIPEATFQSAALAFRVSDLRTDQDDTGARTTGDVTFRADLDQLHKTWRVLAKQLDWKLNGSVQGQVSLVQLDDTTQARWTIDLVGLELARRQLTAPAGNVIPASNATTWATVWREPILKVTGSGECNLASETIVLDRFELDSADKLKLSLHGNLAQPTGSCMVDLQGQVTYDLAKLLRQWAPVLKNQVRWTGHDTQQFRLRGPLFVPSTDSSGSLGRAQSNSPTLGMIPPALYGESGIRWQSADLLGISIGAGGLRAKLEAGAIQTGVIELPISGGTLRIEPTVHLNRHPPVISITPGQVLTNVQITTGMCDQWLKYIAPIAADATQAQGQFSLSLGQTEIPLRQPVATRATGMLKVHAASIGPGPLARQLILVANNVKSILQLQLSDFSALGETTWVRLPQQQTQFQIVDRRVYHDRLLFETGGVLIHTRGSVGFDQSLSLVAQIPIRDEWIAGNARLAALRGQTVQIPIGGTLDNPRVDQRALERLATDAVRQATSQILEDELKKGVQRWLGPRQ